MLFLWILHQLTMPKDRTEVSCCVKYLLFFFNVFFWVSLYDKYKTSWCLLTSKTTFWLKWIQHDHACPHHRIFPYSLYLTWCYMFSLVKKGFRSSATRVIKTPFPLLYSICKELQCISACLMNTTQANLLRLITCM